jgi:bla regulator protein blaR1
MTLAHLGIDANLLRALGWSLLHFLWQGTILAIALSGFLQVARTCSSKFRYLACCTAFALMVLCLVVTFVYLADNVNTPSHTSTLALLSHPNQHPLWQDTSSPLFESFIATANREMPWILVLWCTGVLVFLSHLIIGSIAAERLKAASRAPAPDWLQDIANRLRKQLNISEQFQLFTSNAITSPSVIGWVRPVILVPLASLTGLSPEHMEAMLAHELAHIRRQDYLVNTLQAVAEALLFYHPAVCWVSKQVRREREHCSDDVAVMISGSPLIYAKALSLLEEQRSSAQPQLTLGANGGQLAMRIKRLLTQKQPTMTSRGTTFSLISIGMITICALFLFSKAATSGVRAESAPTLSQASSAAITSTKSHARPDMSCTYYDVQVRGRLGTCEAHQGDQGHYYCTSNDDKKLSEMQTGCEWKVQRLQAWKFQQNENK